jgi:hypothetical protein
MNVELNEIAKTLLQLHGLKLAERRRLVLGLPKLTGRELYALPADALDLYLRSLPPRLRSRAFTKWKHASFQIQWEAMSQEERGEVENISRSLRKPKATTPLQQRILELGQGDIEAGYRVLARTMHPDCGGSHEQMVELNRAMSGLRPEKAAEPRMLSAKEGSARQSEVPIV